MKDPPFPRSHYCHCLIAGVFHTAGRVVSGFISFIPRLSPVLVSGVTFVLAAVTMFLMTLCTTYVTMAVNIAIYGVLSGE